MLVLKEERITEDLPQLTYADTPLKWDQAIELLKEKHKFAVSVSTGSLRGFGFDVDVNPAKLKFYPAAIEFKTSSLLGRIWFKGILSVGAHVSSADDSTVIVTFTYHVGSPWERVRITGV